MISSNLLQDLTESESDILYFILNSIYPIQGVEINENTIKSYKKHIFDAKIKTARQYVKEENIEIYNSLCQKLEIK